MHYLVKAVHKRTKAVTYYMQGHSTLTGAAKVVSRYYVYEKERPAKNLMSRLMKSRDGMDYDWSVVTAEEEDIEVV